MALDITSAQKTSCVDVVDTFLNQALGGGVTADSVPFLDSVSGYSSLTPAQQQLIRDTFKLVIAAWLKNMNGATTSVATGGGTLVFTNGILTAVI